MSHRKHRTLIYKLHHSSLLWITQTTVGSKADIFRRNGCRKMATAYLTIPCFSWCCLVFADIPYFSDLWKYEMYINAYGGIWYTFWRLKQLHCKRNCTKQQGIICFVIWLYVERQVWAIKSTNPVQPHEADIFIFSLLVI